MSPFTRICYLGLLMCAACAPPPAAKPAREWQVSVGTPPASAPEAEPVSHSTAIQLRGALAPSGLAQGYRIAYHVDTRLHGDTQAGPGEILELELTGTLEPAPASAQHAALILIIQRVRGRVERSIEGDHLRSFQYDSEGITEPDPLHGILSPLVGARLRLLITPTGQLRQLRGVTQLTRGVRAIAPSDLASIRRLLNDAAFELLVSAALFPPMPSSPMLPTDQWELLVRASPLDPCPTVAAVKGRQAGTWHDRQRLPVIQLEAKGPIYLDAPNCPVQLIHGEFQFRQSVSWNDHSLSQWAERRLEFAPARDEADPSVETRGRYVRTETLMSSRAGAAAQSRPE